MVFLVKKHHVFAANLVNEENQENELGSEFCNDENIVMMEWGKKKNGSYYVQLYHTVGC